MKSLTVNLNCLIVASDNIKALKLNIWAKVYENSLVKVQINKEQDKVANGL